MDTNKTISIVMPVYNSLDTVEAAILSILGQSRQSFEFIIIDDGCTDGTSSVLEQYAQQDSRIQVHRQQNQGVTAALNLSLDLAAGDFIAIMHADDISLPHRFDIQLRYMQEHPNIGICGTQVEIFGEKTGYSTAPTDPQQAAMLLLFRPPVYHPTVMLRRSLIIDYALRYDPDNAYPAAEDYDMWVRASAYTQISNVPQTLLKYRISRSQITQAHSSSQQASTYRIYRKLLAPFHIVPTENELRLHLILAWRQVNKLSPELLSHADDWLQKLIKANAQYHVYPQAVFNAFLANLWYLTCRAYGGGITTWRTFMQSPLRQYVPPSKWLKLLAHVL